MTPTNQQRLEALQSGLAVTVAMNITKGRYVDPVAAWAAENSLLTYCGRRNYYTCHQDSPWLNPFTARHGTRDEVCDLFETEVLPTLDVTPLKGRALGCWCYPKRCHCDALAAKANN